ncbi:MAG TPA: hypothetical protein VK530_01090 [Candidatus Acidoferrum sp.]|nr:hypothetical protein [Candidatus Acidoferrum sp.]
MNSFPESMQRDLQAHHDLCLELLVLAKQENESFRAPEDTVAGQNDSRRKKLLPQLDQSLALLLKHRVAWQKLPVEERARHPEVSRLVRVTQELGMKIIVLDRENEQLLLRRGLLPARQIAVAASHQPNYVAGLYQRHRQNMP